MGRVKFNDLIKGSSGRIGNLILKQTRRGTYLSSRPDRSKVTLSPKQKKSNGHFSEAVKYGKTISKDPERIALHALLPEPKSSLYHTGIKEFMGSVKKSGADLNLDTPTTSDC